jgi:hypothetical protein
MLLRSMHKWSHVVPSRQSLWYTHGSHPHRVAHVGMLSSAEVHSSDSGLVAPVHECTLSDVDDSSHVSDAFALDARMEPRGPSPAMSITTFFDAFDRRPRLALVALAAAHRIKTVCTENVEQIRNSIPFLMIEAVVRTMMGVKTV